MEMTVARHPSIEDRFYVEAPAQRTKARYPKPRGWKVDRATWAKGGWLIDNLRSGIGSLDPTGPIGKQIVKAIEKFEATEKETQSA